MNRQITKEDVSKALDSFEAAYEDTVSKASEHGLDQPEGGDMGNPEKNKMSDYAKAKKSSDLAEGKGSLNGRGDAPKVDYGDGSRTDKSKKSAKPEHDDAADAIGNDDLGDEPAEGAPNFGARKGKMKKSFSEDMPDEVQTKIDVSEFLKSLVDHTGECIDDLAKSVSSTENRIAKSHGALVDAVEDVQKSQAKIGIVLKAICQRIGIIENRPARSAQADTVSKGGAQERTFNSGLAEEGGAPVFKSLSQNPMMAKSQISSALCEMVKKGEAQDVDVIGFETSGHIRPELMPALKTAFN